MGCRVEVFTDRREKYAVEGNDQVTALRVGENIYPCQAVFILRSGTAPDTLLEGLKMNGSHIVTDENRAASVPGVFAAGDCVGPPYQVAKAVGDGNIAALSASKYLEDRK